MFIGDGSPDEAVDRNHAEGIALGMTDREAELWSMLCDLGGQIETVFWSMSAAPLAFTTPFYELRAALLAMPATRALDKMQVEPSRVSPR